MQELQETQVQSLGWENPLEKEMATHSSILAWEILWTGEPGGLPILIMEIFLYYCLIKIFQWLPWVLR